MIMIKARGWQQFLAAFGVLRRAGVEPVAAGGNQMRVPDDTDRDVLRAVAATGAVVHADLTEPPSTETTPEPPDPEADTGTEAVTELEPDAPPPSDEDASAAPPVAPAKRTPRKATRSRRTRTTEE
ncbi:hypothetical protein K1W54_04620 [Micromonospora sp. CPCC 205371]|nr:hypothetical protein [Micromonospora sp. CPCC 205371]